MRTADSGSTETHRPGFLIPRLIWVLSVYNLRQRYRGRILRTSWLVIQPLFYMSIFTLVFRHITRFSSEGAPYPLFSLCALVPWIFLSGALRSGCTSLTFHRVLITRLSFPRLAIPLASVAVHLTDLAVMLTLFTALNVFYGKMPGEAVFFLLPVIGVQLILAFGLGLLFSISNAYVRDTENIVSILTQAWLFASPVAYSAHIVPKTLEPYFRLNPAVGILDGYRRIFLHGQAPDMGSLGTAFIVSSLTLLAGLLIFLRFEKNLGDIL